MKPVVIETFAKDNHDEAIVMDENRISDMALEYANSHGGAPFARIAIALAYEQGAKDAIEIIKKEGVTC